jgi:hypothetical protein
MRALLQSVIGLLVTTAAFGASVWLTPIADTSLIEFLPANNLGGGTELLGGTSENLTRHRPLIKFDVAGNLPPGARITGAQFAIDVTKVPQNGFAFADYGLHRMLKPWGEGSQVSPTNCTSCAGWGSPATTNEACWDDPFAFAAGDWTSPGAAPTNDFLATPASVTTVYKDENYVFVSTPALVADVQLWLDEPGTNFGWMLLCQAEGTPFSARRFGSREHPFTPPTLAIDYLVPPRIEIFERVGSNLRLGFTPTIGQSYAVEVGDTLETGTWQTLTNLGPAAAADPIVVTDPLAPTNRFYRVMSQ